MAQLVMVGDANMQGRTISFETWKAAVDTAIAQRLAGMNSDDLPDYDYFTAYRNRQPVQVVAARAIKAAKAA